MMAVQSPPVVMVSVRCPVIRRKGSVTEACNHVLLRVNPNRWEEVVTAQVEIKCPKCRTIHDLSKWV